MQVTLMRFFLIVQQQLTSIFLHFIQPNCYENSCQDIYIVTFTFMCGSKKHYFSTKWNIEIG